MRTDGGIMPRLWLGELDGPHTRLTDIPPDDPGAGVAAGRRETIRRPGSISCALAGGPGGIRPAEVLAGSGRCRWLAPLTLPSLRPLRVVVVLLTVVLSGAIAITPARAGALFDDYLNYVRPGPGTGPGDGQVQIQAGSPVGQSLSLPPRTAEIYRIGIRPVYESWGEGEKVTLVLFDSPEKQQELARYAIAHGTHRVQPVHETQDRILWFHLRAALNQRTQIYFELQVEGGDGQITFQGLAGRDHPGGSLHGGGRSPCRDLAFECQVKPVADRVANLRAFFTQRLNLERPELAAVRQAVEAGAWEEAVAAAADHFHRRMDVWGVWKHEMEVRPDPQYDSGPADLLLNHQLRHRETKQPLPWRPESYWVPEYPAERTDPKHVADPSLYLWHVDRVLGGAYCATGRADYARKSIELRMQFILDNPNPKTTGNPWYFELWNDRTAAGRAPGHGTLAYARLYHYPGWTPDQRLVFFAFLEDNARYVYQAETGANWGAEAAKACYEFGLKFPEWRMSRSYVQWGTHRLAEIALRDVRTDGTSVEAAIKYHAMVARRLKGLLEDHARGEVNLNEDLRNRLITAARGMYDHIAWTLMPNGYVVMGGDSWYENFAEQVVDGQGNVTTKGELVEAAALLEQPAWLWIASQGRQGTPPNPVSRLFPQGRYFIMRSDFGGEGREFTDARHLLVHNGTWFGSHGHFDLLGINLYAYGRPLVIDPGQYDYEPPPGIDRYWQSKIHSTLVLDGHDMRKEPGPNIWFSNAVLDWLDGRHSGYASRKHRLGEVRRRIMFIKPDYFVVDDFAEAEQPAPWAQVWNLTDPQAAADPSTGSIRTTFPEGGNLLILNQDPQGITFEQVRGITCTDQIPETRIYRLVRNMAHPRFQTLVYPFKGADLPGVAWERWAADQGQPQDLSYSLLVRTPAGTDWIAFGEPGRSISYAGGKDRLQGAAATVRTDGEVLRHFAWVLGRELTHNRILLAAADRVVHHLAVRWQGTSLVVEAEEAEPSLKIRTGGAQGFLLNGRVVEEPVVREGFWHPFADQPVAIIADNADAFVRHTAGDEWELYADPEAYGADYLVHETDPGRGENGDYVFEVPSAGRYRIELFVPPITHHVSDRITYTIPATGVAGKRGGPIVGVRIEDGKTLVTVNHQTKVGWISLGDYPLPAGPLRINARNVTTIDGLYYIADCMRLIPLSGS